MDNESIKEISENLGVQEKLLREVLKYVDASQTVDLLDKSRSYETNATCKTPLYDLLVSKLNLQLGAEGRLELKSTISRCTAGRKELQQTLSRQINPLKSATVQQLIQISEVVGCLDMTMHLATVGRRRRLSNSSMTQTCRKRRLSSYYDNDTAAYKHDMSDSFESCGDTAPYYDRVDTRNDVHRRSERVKRQRRASAEDRIMPLDEVPPPPTNHRKARLWSTERRKLPSGDLMTPRQTNQKPPTSITSAHQSLSPPHQLIAPKRQWLTTERRPHDDAADKSVPSGEPRHYGGASKNWMAIWTEEREAVLALIASVRKSHCIDPYYDRLRACSEASLIASFDYIGPLLLS